VWTGQGPCPFPSLFLSACPACSIPILFWSVCLPALLTLAKTHPTPHPQHTPHTQGFIQEIRHRDTEDRRKLYYGHRAVSVAWEMIHILHAHNHQLLKSLQVAGNDVEAVARAFLSFAAAEKAYSIYCANHAEALLGLDKVLGPTLIKYTKDHPVAGGLTVSRYLNLPFERFPQYVEFLQAVKALTATSAGASDSEEDGMPAAASSTSATLEAAIQAMEEGLRCVTVATNEFARQNELVSLQAQFMGYVDLYAPDRCLVKEGLLTKIYLDGSKRKPQERYTHLLSDAFIYSNTLMGPYKYKLAKIHGLHLVAAAVPVAEDPTMFDLTKAAGEGETIRFQAPDKATAIEWMDAINAQATAQKAKAALQNAAVHKAAAATEPREARVNALSFLKKHGAALEGLPDRSKTIAYGLKADLTYCEYLKVFARVVGVTLDELSRGIGAVGGKRGSVENGDAERANGLFETKTKTFNQLTEGTVNRVKAAHAGKPLQSPEMAVFLKVLPVLESLSQALVERLEERLTAHSQTGAEFCIGDIYLDMSALFVAYQSYASVMDEAELVLGNPALVELAESLSDELSPLTIQQHLTAPLEAAQRMAIQMKAVLEMTPEEHPDHQALALATLMMEQTATGMLSNQQDTKDYWKLVSIREAIGSMEFKDSPLETLVTADRKLILEGNLLKACRSKDKAYMFWLFTDALLYATQLATSHLYQLNRWMALTEMNVQASVQEATGLDILTAEKSFTVFTKDVAERDMWLERISEAVNQAKEAAGMSTDPASLQVAPILVQTSDSKDCALCHTAFTIFMRKHHCLSCGNVVCDKCSPSRMILPNIHKTERQRVCNACVAGETHHIRAVNTATGELGIHPALAPVEPKVAALVEEEHEGVEEENEAPQRVAPLLFSPGAGNAAPSPSWLTSPQHSISPGGLASLKNSPTAAAAEPVYAPVMVDGWTASQAYEPEDNANPFSGDGEGLAMPEPIAAAAEAEVEVEEETETPAVEEKTEAAAPVIAVETTVIVPAPVASFAIEPVVVAPVVEIAAPAAESTPLDFEQAAAIEPVEEVRVFETNVPFFEAAPFETPEPVVQSAVPAFDTFDAPAPLPLSLTSRKLSLSASAGVAPLAAAGEGEAAVVNAPAREAVSAVEFNDPFDI